MKVLKICTQCNTEYYTYKSNVKNSINTYCSMKCYGDWQKHKSLVEQGKKPRPKRYCDVVNCKRIHFGKGYCKFHYSRIIEHPYTEKFIRSSLISKIHCKFCNKLFEVYPSRALKAKYCSMICSGLHQRSPFILKKGYKKILDYQHPRADKKGYVFEHIVVMEKHLNRPILEPEVIHHIDHDRGNNKIENLMLFANHSDHIQYHKNNKLK